MLRSPTLRPLFPCPLFLCPLLPCLLGAAWAADLPAPDVELHPDGARIAWTLVLAADEETVDLPAWCDARTAVAGAASWRIEERPATPPLPAALAALRAGRNALIVRRAGIDAEGRQLDAIERRLRARLPRLAAADADPTAWQASLDALDARRAALDAERGRALDAGEDLRRRAGDDAPLLALDGSEPLTEDDLLRRWDRAHAGSTTRRLVLRRGEAGSVRIAAVRSDLAWTPLATLRLAPAPGGSAVLARAVTVRKPLDLALAPASLRAVGTPLVDRLQRPTAPLVRVAAEEVVAALRRQLVGGERSVDWSQVGAAAPAVAVDAAAAPASSVASSNEGADSETGGSGTYMAIGAGGGSAGLFGSRSGGGRKRAVARGGGNPASAIGVELPATSPSPVAYDLGPLALPAGTVELTVAVDAAPVAMLADEWALFPEQDPVALRRVTVRLDGRPLPAGRIQVLAGGPPIADDVPFIAGGSTLTVCAGFDETVVVATSSAWAVDPAINDDRHRRAGTDHWLVSSGTGPRTVSVYRTMPVSTSDELAVARDPESTPDAEQVAPGLLRWRPTLTPGQVTRIGLGWTLAASGSFRF